MMKSPDGLIDWDIDDEDVCQILEKSDAPLTWKSGRSLKLGIFCL